VLQDYDILLKAHLSPNFVRWKAGGAENPLSLDYRTTNASNAANKVDIQVYDTNGVPVTLSGSVSNLANTSWTTSGIDIGSGGTWTPGQDFLIRIRASAKDNFQVHIGSLKMQYVELRRE
jgi:type 1 fimbria pilin